MKKLQGISASPGIVIGKVFLYLDENLKIPKYKISSSQIQTEYSRFMEAIEKAKDELNDLKHNSTSEIRDEDVKFLDSHLLMVNDPELFKKIETDLKEKKYNIEWILYDAIENFIDKLNRSEESYFRERTIDFVDVSRRVLNHLLYRERISLSDLQEEVILVAHDLLPSDALQMNKRFVKGIAMDAGGKTSHTAILARSFEIPAVLGLSSIVDTVENGDPIIVDGNSGIVIINPDEETKHRYINTWHEWQKRELKLQTLNALPAETRDGKLIALNANIEVPEEIDSVLSHGSDGIGLFRSEFLFLQPQGLSSEDDQFEHYVKVIKGMAGKSVTIRTLDVGGDKIIPDLDDLNEKNPILGWRAIRFCLSRRDIFKIQLRALLRASIYGNLRIMFPLISGGEELDQIIEFLEEVKSELIKEGIEFDTKVPIGIMIEVPSAALISDILAKRVNFFSIGTNDLIQYTIAVDRGNERIAYLYEPFHPGVLRLIKMTCENAHKNGIPVSMCGEMAGDPIASVILLGLGLDELSMTPFGIPEIKRIIRSIYLSEAEELVGTIMEMRSHQEINDYVIGWLNERFDFINV